MIKPVYGYGNLVLRKKAQDIDAQYKGLTELISNMFETMYASDGVGLAAPQIGLAIRLFIIDASTMDEDFPEAQDFKEVFINPRILSCTGDEWPFVEGCLSVPGIREEVLRPADVTIHYFDEHFTEHTKTFTGIVSRIIQHEYDHLEGKLFIDHLNPLKKRLLKKRLTSIENGTIPIDYKMKFLK
jgi:peptide deformylase